ncbi:MAG: hypothetical protein CSB44_01290 [Gammaproteobacteria bacterium]|nr:MAG: hypothetical protein CSB44_01290 [Gammaproteobacteria bacterium]
MSEFSVSALFALFALLAVLALAWLVLRALSMLRRTQGDNKLLKHKATLVLGQHERLVVVEYEGDDLLLGVTANGVTLLGRHDPEPSGEETAC